MYLDAATSCYKTKDRVAIDGMTTLGQLKVNALQVLVNDKHVILIERGGWSVNCGVKLEVGCRTCHIITGDG